MNRRMNRLSMRERHVLMLLRRCSISAIGQGRPGPACRESLRSSTIQHFVGLAAAAHRFGLGIFALESTFASEDECAILGGLNAYQRPALSSRWRPHNPLHSAMRACAHALIEEGWKLPARHALVALFAELPEPFAVNVAPSAAALASADPEDLRTDARSPEDVPDPERLPEGLKARALGLIGSNATVKAAEFHAIGISRQYLSLLCKWGYVARVGYGFYRAPVSKRMDPPDSSAGGIRTPSR